MGQKKIAVGVDQDHFSAKQVVLSLQLFSSIQGALDHLEVLRAQDSSLQRCVYLGLGTYEESLKIENNAMIVGYSPSFTSSPHLSLSVEGVPSPKRHRRVWQLPTLRAAGGSARIPITCNAPSVELKNMRVESEEECVRVKGGKLKADGCVFTSVNGKPCDGSEDDLSLSSSSGSLFPVSSLSLFSSFTFANSPSTVRRRTENRKYKSNYLVVMEGEGEGDISRCRFFDGTLGVFASGQSLTATDNMFQNLQWGMVIATKQKSHVTHNQAADCRTGLLVQSSAAASIRSNQFHHNVIGLSVLSSASAELQDNQIFQNSASGIYLQANSSAIVKSTSIFENSEKGVIAFDRCQLTIEDSNIYGNGQSGICLEEDSVGKIRNNRIYLNKWGVSLLNSSSLEVEGNAIYSNQIRGVSVQDFSKATLLQNELFKNAEGIVGTHESKMTVFKTRIYNNKNIGLSLRDQACATIEQCQVHGNSRGVTLMNKTVAEIKENEIFENVRCGISIRDNAEAKMNRNSFSETKELECNLNEMVKTCVEKDLCTFSITGKSFVEQNWYNCQTCFPNEDNSGVCEVCVKKCHAGHKLSVAKFSSFYCDCGAKENEEGVKNKFSCLCAVTGEH